MPAVRAPVPAARRARTAGPRAGRDCRLDQPLGARPPTRRARSRARARSPPAAARSSRAGRGHAVEVEAVRARRRRSAVWAEREHLEAQVRAGSPVASHSSAAAQYASSPGSSSGVGTATESRPASSGAMQRPGAARAASMRGPGRAQQAPREGRVDRPQHARRPAATAAASCQSGGSGTGGAERGRSGPRVPSRAPATGWCRGHGGRPCRPTARPFGTCMRSSQSSCQRHSSPRARRSPVGTLGVVAVGGGQVEGAVAAARRRWPRW